jgi:protein SCO1/2
MNPKRLLTAIVVVTALAMGTWYTHRTVAPRPVPETATVMPEPGELVEFSLVDHNGDLFTRDDLLGNWSLVFFGFTHCPDVCPLTLQVLATAKQSLQEADQQPLPRIVFISVDPARDTPESIGQYVRYFDDGAVAVTGEVNELRKLAGSLGAFFEKSSGDGENYGVNHSSTVHLINPDARLQAVFNAPHEANSFVHDLPLIVATR